MGRKKTRAADIKRRLSDDDSFPSPFASIKLVEKKEEEKKAVKQTVRQVAPKKPSEIVQGYNPSSSFADILYAYEHTGNPYVMPSASRKKEIAESKTDFGTILDQWEGRSNPNQKKKTEKREEKKSTYHPTKSFGDILAAFDGTAPAKEIKNENKEAEENVVDPTTSFFKAESDDEKRSPEASWSIFGSNESFVREEKAEKEKKEEPVSKKIERVSRPYNPTKSFADILSSYEHAGKKHDKEEKPVIEIKKAVVEEQEEESLFKKESDDEKRSPEAVWSIFGNNRIPERKSEESKSGNSAPAADMEKSLDLPDFAPLFSAYEKKSEKTFDEILKEKGDLASQKKELTISKLRTMMPQSTLDLHGYTVAEAESCVKSFLDECRENGLRKISIITGKGLHSEDGIGVLRDAVIHVLDESGIVSEKYSAPQSAGGSGALWIILKA